MHSWWSVAFRAVSKLRVRCADYVYDELTRGRVESRCAGWLVLLPFVFLIHPFKSYRPTPVPHTHKIIWPHMFASGSAFPIPCVCVCTRTYYRAHTFGFEFQQLLQHLCGLINIPGRWWSSDGHAGVIQSVRINVQCFVYWTTVWRRPLATPKCTIYPKLSPAYVISLYINTFS